MNLDLVGLMSSGSVSISIPRSKKLRVSTRFSLTISNVAVLVDCNVDPIPTLDTLDSVVIPVSEKFLRPVGCKRPFTVDDNLS